MTNALLSPTSTPTREIAEEALVREHLPLVGYLVAEVLAKVPSHVSRAELTSAGLAALAFAARAYEPDRGVPFTAFASIRIRGALIDEMRNTDWASRSVRTKARRQEEVGQMLTTELGRTPTDAEVADALGVSPAELGADRHDVHRAVVLSLDGFADPKALESLAPSADAEPEDQLLAHERIGYLHDAVLLLPERLRLVVTQYYFEEPPTTGRAAKRQEAYFAAVATNSDYRARLSARPVDTRSRKQIRSPARPLRSANF